MSNDVHGKVTRDGVQIYPSTPNGDPILFQVDRMSVVEALAYSEPPYYLYNVFCTGLFDLRQYDLIIDLYNKDPVTQQSKAYKIVNEPESFPDGHLEFDAAKADRAALARGN